MISQDLITVFLMGLAGSVHCVGMCGGIASLLGSQIKSSSKSATRLLGYHLLYNLGRLTSYTVAGMLIAGLGQWIALAGQSVGLPNISRLIIGLLTVFFGVYLLGWTVFLLPLEKAGSFLWQRIEPVARKFLPVQSPAQALVLGLLWGWLPCGMVYVALSWTVVVAEPLQGGLLMAAFGLGTLPAMMGIGMAGSWLMKILAKPSLRAILGSLVALYGLVLMAGFVMGTGSHLHH